MSRLLTTLSVSLVVIALFAPASAQDRSIQLDGWVQWISGDRMMLAANGGGSVPIELGQVPQDQYMRIRPRDRVTVIGVVSNDNRRISAMSVIFSAPGWADQSP
ncbi:MAG: hypothetical protein C5B48_05710 [Candidatus Rokuibacteriota bacterium]|nr:MAG: hypothetical protein C5B48_05710 [Candidatus Rokubacteria bacterium]